MKWLHWMIFRVFSCARARPDASPPAAAAASPTPAVFTNFLRVQPRFRSFAIGAPLARSLRGAQAVHFGRTMRRRARSHAARAGRTPKGRVLECTHGEWARSGPPRGGARARVYSAQSAMKTFVSPTRLPLRFEAKTSFLPSGENIGKPSKPS